MTSSSHLTHVLVTCLLVTYVSGKIVRTTKGQVEGTTGDANGKLVYVYNGIPFAKPPIGPLRFEVSSIGTTVTGSPSISSQIAPTCGLLQSSSRNTDLSVASWNARSVCNKASHIHELIVENRYDIVTVTESWLREDGGNGTVLYDMVPDGYKITSKPRVSDTVGGESFKCKTPDTTPEIDFITTFEFVENVFTTNKHSLHVICLYRPPSLSKAVFLDDLETLLSIRAVAAADILLLGDINIHMDDSDDSIVKRVQTLFEQFNLTSHVTVATHQAGHVIDVIASPPDIHTHDIHVINTTLSDHFLLQFKISSHVTVQKEEPTETETRKISKVCTTAFLSDIADKLVDLYAQGDPDAALAGITTALTDTLDQHAPLVSCKPRKRKPSPWMTSLLPVVNVAKPREDGGASKLPTLELTTSQPDPVAMDPWQGVKNAIDLPNSCLNDWANYPDEYRTVTFTYSEDCLYLNVFVPDKIPDRSAVLIVLHGGSNQGGSGVMHDGKYLASYGKIIVVTVNYRLGVVGFLGTGHPDFRGNFGLLDQIMAMRWVRDNIHFFSGDKNMVTLFGQSAGAYDVGLHVVSPLAKGLFKRAISQSGPPTSVMSWQYSRPDPIQPVRTVTTLLNCQNTFTLVDMKECLKSIPDMTGQTSQTLPGVFDALPARAIVDGHFLTDDPAELMRNGQVNVKEYLIGFTATELDVWIARGLTSKVAIPYLQATMAIPEDISVDDAIWYAYKDWSTDETGAQSTDSSTLKQSIAKMYSDIIFLVDTVLTANMLVGRGVKVSMYEWNRRPISGGFIQPWFGVHHGIDMYYLFGDPIQGGKHFRYNFTDLDRDMSYIAMDAWSNYVKYGQLVSSSAHSQLPLTDPSITSRLLYGNIRKTYHSFGLGGNGKPQITEMNRPLEGEVRFWHEHFPMVVAARRAAQSCEIKNTLSARILKTGEEPWVGALWLRCVKVHGDEAHDDYYLHPVVIIDRLLALTTYAVGSEDPKDSCEKKSKTNAYRSGSSSRFVRITRESGQPGHADIDVREAIHNGTMGNGLSLLLLKGNTQSWDEISSPISVAYPGEYVNTTTCRRVTYRRTSNGKMALLKRYVTKMMAFDEDDCGLLDFDELSTICVNDYCTDERTCEVDNNSPIICDDKHGTPKILGFPKVKKPNCVQGHRYDSWFTDVRSYNRFIGSTLMGLESATKKSKCGKPITKNERQYLLDGAVKQCGDQQLYSVWACGCQQQSVGDVAVSLADYNGRDATTTSPGKYPGGCGIDARVFEVCAACGRQLQSSLIYEACCVNQKPLADRCWDDFKGDGHVRPIWSVVAG